MSGPGRSISNNNGFRERRRDQYSRYLGWPGSGAGVGAGCWRWVNLRLGE